MKTKAEIELTEGRVSNGTRLYVEIDNVMPDPDQPRKLFDAEKLKELTESIKAQGIIQDLLVRPSKDGKGYVVIDGERRWRAAKLAGLTTVPVAVREGADVTALQLVANQQRENLTALEEASAYRKRVDAGTKPDDLAKELGVSRATVFGRLALVKVSEPVKQELLAGNITPSVAGLIGMVPDVKQQEKLLEEVKGGIDPEDLEMAQEDLKSGEMPYDDPQPGWSFRRVQEVIEEKYCAQLKGAPFKQDDAELVPTEWEVSDGKTAVRVKGKPTMPAVRTCKAICDYDKWRVFTGNGTNGAEQILGPNYGKEAKAFAELVNGGKPLTVERVLGGACTDCPFRSGNLPNFPEAVKRPNICTKPACYHQKCKAYWTQRAQKDKAAGKTVLDATEYNRSKGQYIDGAKHEYTQNKSGSWKQLMGKHAPKPALAVTPKGLIEVYPKAEAYAAARKNGVKFYAQNKPETPEEKAKAEEQEKEKKRKTEQRRALVAAAGVKLAAILEALPDKKAWELMEEHFSRHSFYNYGRTLRDKMKMKSAKGHVLANSLVGMAYPLDWEGTWISPVKIWKSLGIDLAALEAAEEKRSLQTATSPVKTLAGKPAKKKAMVKK